MRTRPPALYQLLGLNPQGDLGPWTCYRTRRGLVVWFIKAPPKTPPSDWQILQRARWTVIADAWQLLPANVQEAWLRAAPAAGLRVGGYNLYVWYNCAPDPAALATICRRAGITPGDLI